MTRKRSRSIDESESTNKDSCPLCYKYPKADKDQWIQCDICDQWYHQNCVELKRDEVEHIVKYHCTRCAKDHGESEKVRLSSRKRMAVDYIALNSGDTIGALNAAKEDESRHKFWYYIGPDSPIDLSIGELPMSTGEPLKVSHFNDKIAKPYIIPKKYYDILDMEIPENLTVREITRIIGEDHPVPVMQVKTQQNSSGWTLGAWRDYFYSDEEGREEVLNVISLEFSDTPLGKMVSRPNVVRDMDLIQKVWPKNEASPPKVSLYCLMSVKNSFTDFHVDFGGSSVFYHICSGQKTFLFIEPTKENLKKYEKWCLDDNQTSVFFATLVEKTYRVDLFQGDTMIIPSGWIHAVYTPVDSLIIGGNFLTAVNMDTQIQLSKLEKRTNVPQKFRFPYFSKVLWYTALKYMENWTFFEDIPLNFMQGLLSYLKEEMNSLKSYYENAGKQSKNSEESHTALKSRQLQSVYNAIPKQLRADPFEFLSQLQAKIDHVKTEPS